MSDERIETYVNRSGVQGDTEFMLQQFNSINDAFEKINGLKLTLGKDNSFKSATDSATGLKKATDDVSLAVQAFSKVNNENATIQAKLSASTSDAAKSNAELKIQLQQATAANKSAAQEALGMVDAYGKLKQQYNEAANAAKNLQTIAQASGNSSDQAAAEAATTKAKALHDQLLSIEQAVGQSQRNVGNYTGALRVLEASLADVQGQMTQLVAAGQQDTQVYATLAKEAGLLNILVGEQASGFASVTAEIRNSERALQTIRATIGEDNAAFTQLREATVQANQSQKEFQRQQKLLEGEAPALGALILAAKGLGAGYAIGASATALFAEGNEKLEREFGKLIAIMTLLQGLSEAYATVQQSGAIATALHSAETKGLTLATELYAAATGTAVVATETLEATLIASGIGVILVALAAGAALLVSKIIDLSNADEKAIENQKLLAEATIALNETIAKEIGLVGKSNEDQINGLKSQLALLEAAGVNREQEYALKTKIAALDKEQSDKAIASATQLAFTEQSNLESLAFQAEKKRQLNDLNTQLKNGEINVFEFTQKTAAINASFSKDQITQENALAKSRDFHFAQYQQELKQIDVLQQASRENAAAGIKDPDALTKRIAALQAQAKADKAQADADDELIKNNQETTTAAEVLRIEILKQNAEDRRKIVLAEAEIESDAIQAKNALVLSSDRSSLSQRLAALISNAAAQKSVIAAQKAVALARPDAKLSNGQYSPEAVIAMAKAAEETKKITDSTERAIFDEKESFRLRDLTAEQEINESRINESIKTEQSIFQNVDKSLSDRLSAYKRFVIAQQELLNSQKDTKLSAAGFSPQEITDFNNGLKVQVDGKKITYEELEALQIKYNTESATLTATGAKQVYDIAISTGRKEIEDLKLLNKLNLDSSNADQYNADVQALNTAYQHKLIGVLEYQSKKSQLDSRFAISQSRSEIDADNKSLLQDQAYEDKKLEQIRQAAQNLINAKETGSSDEIDQNKAILDALLKDEKENAALILAIRKKLAADTLALQNKEVDDKKKIDNEKLVLEAQLAKEILSGVQSIVDARYDKEKAQIQSTMDAINAKAQTDIAAENASSDSAQQKADKIAVINQRAAAQNAQLAQEQKKIDHDKAVFDKEIAIMNVAINTAVAISNAIKTVGGVALIPLLAAIGAVEIATIAATPIPTYKLGAGVNGRPKHPGGPAEVGHGKNELAITPAGEMIYTPAVPTTMNFPKDTVVLPDANAAIDALIYSSFRGLDHVDAPAPDSGLLKATNQLIKENRRLQAIIMNKKEANLNVTYQGMEKAYRSGKNWLKYVDEKTNW